MANPGTPNLAPAGPSSAAPGLGEDNFSQRIGIGVAVSICVNLALFAGASLMAREQPSIGPETVHFVAVPSPTATPVASATPAPTPSAKPSAQPTAKPTPEPKASATPEPKVSSTPEPKVSSTPKPEPTVKATPVPVATPKPSVATPRPIATPKPVTVQPTVVPTPVTKPSAQPNVTTRAATKPVVVTNNVTSIVTNPNMATPPPSLVRELSTYKATNLTAMNKGSVTGTTTVAPKALRTSAASAAAITAAPGPSGAAGRPNSDLRRSNSNPGPAGAIGAGPAALNPVVVAPIAESTLSGSTRQLRTVSGNVSRLAGKVGVVALSEKASAVSASTFEVAGGAGNLRAGTVTARQGTMAAGGGATAMSGTPTVITSGAEYSVSAPGAPTRGPVGVRGNKNSVIGAAVTSLQSRGSNADVAAGVAVYGDAPGGSQKGAVGKKAVAAIGDSGALSNISGGGIGPVGSAGTGEGAAGRAGAQGVKGGNGSGIREGGGGGGAAGGRVSGGSGEVAGVPNGVPGGRIASNVEVRTTKAGEANVAKADVKVDTKKIEDKQEIKEKGPKELTFDEVDEVATDKAVTQAPATATSKPSWDPPNVKFSGSVEVRVTINDNGSHTEEIVKGTGVADLDRYLKDFFGRWRWTPGKLDGKPIKTTKLVKFKIN